MLSKKIKIGVAEYQAVKRIYKYTVELNDNEVEDFITNLQKKEGSDDIYDFLNNYMCTFDSDIIHKIYEIDSDITDIDTISILEEEL